MPTNNASLLSDLLGLLRALQVAHQSSHWEATCFSRHLLFERLYSPLGAEIDHVAEQSVFLYGQNVVGVDDLTRRQTKWLDKWGGKDHGEDDCDFACLLCAQEREEDLATALKKVIAAFGSDIPLALDNTLRTIADTHSTHLYLIKQNRLA